MALFENKTMYTVTSYVFGQFVVPSFMQNLYSPHPLTVSTLAGIYNPVASTDIKETAKFRKLTSTW